MMFFCVHASSVCTKQYTFPNDDDESAYVENMKYLDLYLMDIFLFKSLKSVLGIISILLG